MRQSRITLIVAIAVALAAVALSPMVFAADSQAQSKFTLVVNDTQGTVVPPTFFDNLQANTQAVEDAPVSRNGQIVGLAETVYTVTRVHNDDIAVMIECSIELPEGNILFNGTAHLGDVESGAAVPVVGGTGRYAGASGTVVMSVTSDGNTTLDFDFATAGVSSSSVGMPKTGSANDLTGVWLVLISVGVLQATGWSLRTWANKRVS